jgi:hypothetical protein
MNGALFLAGTAFGTFLGIDDFWPFTDPLIHFPRTNFNAIAAAAAGLLIEFGMHATPLARKNEKMERASQGSPIIVPPQG